MLNLEFCLSHFLTLCTTRHMVNQYLVDVKFYSTNMLQG